MSAASDTSEAGAQAGEGWELFAHDADIGVRGHGETLAAAFENAARAMTAAMVDPGGVRPRETVPIACTAPDAELLLVDWLNALVFEMATRSLIFGDFSVQIADGRLEAEARGEPIDALATAPAVEVKGATLTALSVDQGADGSWTAQCVIDV